MNPPAFQFYVDDFLGGTMHFTDAETGLYTRLLCVQWSVGSLPDNDDELSSYGKGATPIHRVKLKFKKGSDGRLRNTRMEIERKKQNAFRKSRALNGKLGGRPRKPSDNLVVSDSLGVGKATKSSPSPSPSPVSIEKKEGRDAALSPSFPIKEIFDAWNATPGLPQCLTVSDSRRRSLAVRSKEPFFQSNWRSALMRISKSRFCLGENDRGWKASFDWFIRPDTVAKISEGKYDNAPLNGFSSKPAPKSILEKEVERMAREAGI